MKLSVLIILLVLGAVMVESFSIHRRTKPKKDKDIKPESSESAVDKQSSAETTAHKSDALENKEVSTETANESNADDSQDKSSRVRRRVINRRRKGCRRNGWNGRGGNGDKNRRGGPKITKVMIENVGVININKNSRDKSRRNDRCDEDRDVTTDKPTTTNTPSVDDTTTTTAAVNSDVTPAEQPSRRVRRMASKTAKPKKVRKEKIKPKKQPKPKKTKKPKTAVRKSRQASDDGMDISAAEQSLN